MRHNLTGHPGQVDRGGADLVRLHPITVQPGTGPYYASLLERPDGVLIQTFRHGPAGQRLMQQEVVDAPMHVLLDRMHNIVLEANQRGK